MSICQFVCTILFSILFNMGEGRRLRFVQVLSRHGTRFPSYPNDYDFSNISALQDSVDQLTLEGKGMLYILGQRLREKYWGLLFAGTNYSQSYDEKVIFAKSTNFSRTVESLEAQLLGMLEPFRGQKVLELGQFNFPPFPGKGQDIMNVSQAQNIQDLFTFPIKIENGAESNPTAVQTPEDKVYLNLLGFCPNQEKWEKQSHRSAIAQEIFSNRRIQTALKAINTVYHINNADIQAAFKYYDNYMCLKAMGEKYLPLFQNELVSEQLKFLHAAKACLIFSQDLQNRVYSSGLIQVTINNMKRAISGNPKIVLYSAHDSTIIGMLMALNFTNMRCLTDKYLYGIEGENCYTEYPWFGSTMIFQLWEEEDGTFSVEALMNGKRLVIPVCPGLCTLQSFQKWFQGFRVQDPYKQCGIVKENNQSNPLSYVLFFLAGVIVTLCCLWLYLKCFANQGERVGDEQ